MQIAGYIEIILISWFFFYQHIGVLVKVFVVSNGLKLTNHCSYISAKNGSATNGK